MRVAQIARWISPAIAFRPAAVVGASTGAFGAVWAQAELRKVLSTIGARTLPNEVSCRQAAERFDELLRTERPDEVFVCSQDSTHHDYIVRALHAGCDAYLSKPFTPDALARVVSVTLQNYGVAVR